MRTSSKRLLLAIVVLVLGVVVIFLASYPSEPVYNGKPLGAWANQWGSNHWRIPRTAESTRLDREAEAAIRAIGDKGIPFSLDLMRAQEPGLKKQLRKILPRSWHERLRLENKASYRKVTGAHGLAALGTNGAAAVPGLMELARVEMARNPPDRDDGYLPVWVLGYLREAAEPAVPLLIECLTNRNDSIRLDAAHGLGMINRRPEIVVPALITFFHAQRFPNGAECHAALQSLGMFGTNAAAATSFFVSLLSDKEASFRQVATNWLPYINPTVAEERGVQSPWKALKPGSSQSK
jgi:hypothetical protein